MQALPDILRHTAFNMAGQQLTADNQPVQDLLNLQNDRAMQRYAANTGMTQADMQLAGQKHTLL